MLIEKIQSGLTFHQIFERLSDEKNLVYLDSSDTASKFSRYSFLFFNPFFKFTSSKRDSFHVLKKLLEKYKIPAGGVDFPVSAAAGYISYDAGYLLERINPSAKDELKWPLFELGFYDYLVIHEHSTGDTRFVYTGISKKNKYKRKEDFKKKLDYVYKKLFNESQYTVNRKTGETESGSIKSNFTKKEYVNAINSIKRYIEQGDVYQVNLSQRFYSKMTIDSLDLYNNIRSRNRVPFSSYIKFGRREILSFSMERFLKMKGSGIETRPIKGTMPRGNTPEEDKKNAVELLASKKNNAELLMITDLERNDLGKVCEYDSIYVKKLCEIEKYATVFHLVSTIIGTLKKGRDHIDCLKACFPGGSITGAPKIRAMEIIDELEKVKRSVYCGSIGYFGFNRISEFNIAIRTLLLDKDKIYFNAGGGITYDSDPEDEYEETLHKVRTFLEVL